VDRHALFLGGDEIDVVDAETETADRLATCELREDLACELCVGHKHGIRVPGDGDDVVGIDAFGHAIGRIEPRERSLGRIKRGENTIGHSNYRAGHHKLRMTKNDWNTAKATTAAPARPSD